MVIRSKAPLRIGLAGGGTDVSPYCDLYGGAILNATISLYAYATLEPLSGNEIIFQSFDRNEFARVPLSADIPLDGTLDLLKGVYNGIIKRFDVKPFPFRLSTFADAPAGSGLGTSSTMVVACVGAFTAFFNLPLGEYDIAHLAYEIERQDLNQAGGRQDQYAATFGGVNFMEFYKDDKVIVNPLRIREEYLNELNHNLVLFYTETSRFSSDIIEGQKENVRQKNDGAIEAMHALKNQAQRMKEAILTGRVGDIGDILDYGWQNKKRMSMGITNTLIDDIYDTALKAGATGGKISGAGGGGFMIFYCPGTSKYEVIKQLGNFGGNVRTYSFIQEGLITWITK